MRTADQLARRLGALLGVGLAAAVLIGARVPAGSGELGLDLTVAIAPSGEVGVGRAGPLIAVAGMNERSGAVSGTVELRNQTWRRLPLRLRGLPSARDADQALSVRVAAGGRVLYEGPLGGLRDWTPPELVLGPGGKSTLSVRAWLTPAPGVETAGRIVDVMLEMRPELPR